MADLLEPDLWNVTLPALRAARQRGREYIATGKYVSRLKITEYSENAQGWSTTTKRDLFPSNTAPVEGANIVGPDVGQFSPIAYDEVPELLEAARWVGERGLADQRFLERVSMLSGIEQDADKRLSQVHSEYIRFFVMELVGCAEAIGAESDDELLHLYAELERARFADELKGDLLVPIALTPLDLAAPFQVANDVWIEPLTTEIQRARATSAMYGGRVSAHVVAAASHAVVVRNLAFDNSNLFWRRWRTSSVPALARVNQVLQCLHILTGRDTGFAQAVVRPLGWADTWDHDLPPIWKLSEYHAYPESFDSGGWTEDKRMISADTIEDLPKIFRALESAPANVQLAARRSMRAVTRDDDEDKTLDAAIGIEALLLANSDREEVTHRMALRAATALAADGSEPEIVARLLKNVYTHRSAIVHGRARKSDMVSLGEKEFPAREVASFLLRALLRAHLIAEEPWTPESLDRQIIGSLRSVQVNKKAPREG